MTAPRVTSCPHCKTSFRITQAQLKAANGSVRCGSCLQVFDATSSFDQPKTASPVTIKKTKTEEPEARKEQPLENQKKQVSAEPEKPKKPGASAKHLVVQEQTSDKSTSLTSVFEELEKQEDQLKHQTKLKRRNDVLWGSSAILLGLLLVLQYGWFNRDTLSLDARLRPAYQWSCSILGCSLPSLVDIQAINSQQLLVRSHPDISNALLVDAVIINNASHLQPFPILELSFTDINGNLVASRKFFPREYLAGELAGSKQMPIGQPIRIALEIIDPGQDAVNYSLRFSPDKTT